MRFSSRHNLALVVLLAFVAVVAACGSEEAGKPTVPAGAVAVVGDREIPKAEFDRLVAQAKTTYKAQEQEFPAAGTTEYESLKTSIVKNLVEQAEWEQKAEDMGITVSDEEVDKRLTELKEQYFDGDEKKYRNEIDKQGLTDEQVKREIRGRVLSEKIFKAVTSKVKVTEADVQKYYDTNKAQFAQAESRDVRHILVKRKPLAETIHGQLENGGNFAKLAKRYSQDSSSAEQGGKLTAVKGKTVAPFDKFVFAAEQGDLSKPIKTEFGWHVIEVLGDVKPASATPLAEVEGSIRPTLLQQKQNQAMRQWVNGLAAEFADRIAYAPGFTPAPTGTGTTGG